MNFILYCIIDIKLKKTQKPTPIFLEKKEIQHRHIRIEALLLMECRSLTFKRSLPESSSRCMAFCIIPDLCRKVPHRAVIVQSVMDTLSTRCMHRSHAKMDPRTSLPRIACSLRFRPTFCDEDEADLNDAAGDLLLLLLLLARASSSSSCSSRALSEVLAHQEVQLVGAHDLQERRSVSLQVGGFLRGPIYKYTRSRSLKVRKAPIAQYQIQQATLPSPAAASAPASFLSVLDSGAGRCESSCDTVYTSNTLHAVSRKLA